MVKGKMAKQNKKLNKSLICNFYCSNKQWTKFWEIIFFIAKQNMYSKSTQSVYV